MLATAVDFERAIGKHCAAVLYGRRFVVFIELDLVWTGQIVKGLQIGCERSGERIEGQFFATVSPNWAAGNLREHLEAVHELDDAACFETLTRISKTGAAILVARKSAAGKLAIELHYGGIVAAGGIEKFSVLSLLIIHARLPKALGEIHVVPIMNA